MRRNAIKIALLSAFVPLAAGAQNLGGEALNKAAVKTAGYAEGSTVEGVISTVISMLLGLLGVIFLALTVYGGYMWLIARGDESKVEKAKSTIINSIIGLVIVLAAYAISYFVLTYLLVNSVKSS